jgi:hypothetical protein
VTRPIQPIPTDTTKGVFLYTSLYGHVIVGPTAEDSAVRECAAPNPAVAAKLHDYAVKVMRPSDGVGGGWCSMVCECVCVDGAAFERGEGRGWLGWYSACHESS